MQYMETVCTTVLILLFSFVFEKVGRGAVVWELDLDLDKYSASINKIIMQRHGKLVRKGAIKVVKVSQEG